MGDRPLLRPLLLTCSTSCSAAPVPLLLPVNVRPPLRALSGNADVFLSAVHAGASAAGLSTVGQGSERPGCCSGLLGTRDPATVGAVLVVSVSSVGERRLSPACAPSPPPALPPPQFGMVSNSSLHCFEGAMVRSGLEAGRHASVKAGGAGGGRLNQLVLPVSIETRTTLESSTSVRDSEGGISGYRCWSHDAKTLF